MGESVICGPAKTPQSCSRLIYHFKLFQLSFSRVLRLFLCPLSNVVVMTKWWVPSIVASDRAAAAGLSAHFHMWFYDLRRALWRHDSASLCLVNTFFFSRLHCGPRLRGGVVPTGRKKMHITLKKKPPRRRCLNTSVDEICRVAVKWCTFDSCSFKNQSVVSCFKHSSGTVVFDGYQLLMWTVWTGGFFPPDPCRPDITTI